MRRDQHAGRPLSLHHPAGRAVEHSHHPSPLTPPTALSLPEVGGALVVRAWPPLASCRVTWVLLAVGPVGVDRLCSLDIKWTWICYPDIPRTDPHAQIQAHVPTAFDAASPNLPLGPCVKGPASGSPTALSGRGVPRAWRWQSRGKVWGHWPPEWGSRGAGTEIKGVFFEPHQEPKGPRLWNPTGRQPWQGDPSTAPLRAQRHPQQCPSQSRRLRSPLLIQSTSASGTREPGSHPPPQPLLSVPGGLLWSPPSLAFSAGSSGWAWAHVEGGHSSHTELTTPSSKECRGAPAACWAPQQAPGREGPAPPQPPSGAERLGLTVAKGMVLG